MVVLDEEKLGNSRNTWAILGSQFSAVTAPVCIFLPHVFTAELYTELISWVFPFHDCPSGAEEKINDNTLMRSPGTNIDLSSSPSSEI